ncbi:MAG: SiaB family protein kinase [Bacteroidales bacterium]
MKNKTDDSKKSENSVYEVYNFIRKENLNYIYRGRFTTNFTKNIISLAENNALDEETPADLKRKVYHVMVEGVQNISRHQARGYEDSDLSSGILTIKKENEKYWLTTGNLIENEQVEKLTEKINKINGLDKEQLKLYHKEILKAGKVSERGGAGLGLIDIARRSGTKIKFKFLAVSNQLSFFYLQTIITSEQDENELIEYEDSNSLENIIRLHPLLNKESILIVFYNAFYQDHLLDMLEFLERQMADSNKLKRQIFHIMIEMYQNIIKHGTNIDDSLVDAKQGIFYISETDDSFFLTTGNYMLTKDVRRIRGKLIYINYLDKEMLDKFYRKRLFDLDINTPKSAGLGFIDLRFKSGNKLIYDFRKIDSNFTFFTLKTQISKQR